MSRWERFQRFFHSWILTPLGSVVRLLTKVTAWAKRHQGRNGMDLESGEGNGQQQQRPSRAETVRAARERGS